MLFNSFTYIIFLPIVVFLYWISPKSIRKTILLIASYVFYMNWLPAYGLLIAVLTLVNYAIGKLIVQQKARQKIWFTIGIVFNLSCLCFFKYANFLVESMCQSLSWLQSLCNIHATLAYPKVNIVLPLGISFFTFEFIHYITDVYRGSKPVKNLQDFALFAVFFPSQIAGPIKRFQDFIHQMLDEPMFHSSNFSSGIFLIFQGLFKKIVLGDNIGQIVLLGFNHMDNLGTSDAWLAVVGFTFQIFFDFSGYTDIGRGSALLFGYKVPENFNWPFLAANLTDFWRRWHISLSTWLRDYLFIPLGGSRGDAWQLRRNVLLTMVLGGLWHGAAWHYVIWGFFHGLGLVISKDWHDFVSRIPLLARLRPHPLWHIAGVGTTLLFLFIAGILFRANDIPQALNMTLKLCQIAPAGQVTEAFIHSTIPISLSMYMLFLVFNRHKSVSLFWSPTATIYRTIAQWWNNSVPLKIVAYAALGIVILGFAPGLITPFIYFQF